MAKGKKRISDEEFVRIWQTSVGVWDVAEKCGTNTFAASSRAVRLRKLGIPLVLYVGRRGRPPADVPKLRRLAESLLPARSAS